MNLGLLYSRIREDEKLILSELRDRGQAMTKINIRDLQLGIDHPPTVLDDVDLAFNRALESSRVRTVAQFLAYYDVPVVN